MKTMTGSGISRQTPALGIAALLLATGFLLSGCGGGGGGMTVRCVPTQDHGCVSPAEYGRRVEATARGYSVNSEFSNQWGLRSIGADRAYAHLSLAEDTGVRAGSGVTVGIIDTGIDTTHWAFTGKTVTEEFRLGAADETGDAFSHGTAVASVAAARRGTGFTNTAHGVAWGADLAVFAIPLGSGGGGPYNPVSLPGLASANAGSSQLYGHVIDWRDGDRKIDFLNLSFGYSGIIDSYSETDLRANFGQAITTMAQAGRDDKTIFVWAAGNANGDDCTDGTDHCVGGKVNAKSVEVLAGLVARAEELQGHVVSVVAVKEDGDIADFSNRCGIAAEWCLAAPGQNVLAAYFGPDPDDMSPGFQGVSAFNGTSFAAPMVTGGLAVLKHLFRDQLPNTALVARLLVTADKSGRYADSTIFGQGLMDLGTATAPVGVPLVALGNRVGGGVGLGESRLALGESLGDGLTRSLKGREIAAFDALGAPFWYRLGDFAAAAPGPAMTTRLREFMAPPPDGPGIGAHQIGFAARGGDRNTEPAGLRLGLFETPAGTKGGHFALAEHALTLTFLGEAGFAATAFSTEGNAGRTPASGAALSWRPAGAPVGLRAGWLAERETLLGSSAGRRVRRFVGGRHLHRYRRGRRLQRVAVGRQRRARHGESGHAQWADHRPVAPDDERVLSACHPPVRR